jgi:hypothetical protein
MSTLNRFIKRFNSSQSFRRYVLHAFGEVLLIFTGITLSLWFSNWNDSRKAREVEIKLLREFRTGLSKDLEDVRHTLFTKQRSINSCLRILDLMDTHLSHHDSLNRHFSFALEMTETLETESAYESLKAMGLHTITNDSLRIAIINLYDVSYPALHSSENRHGDLFFNFLVEFNSRRFDSSNPFKAMMPLDYHRLMLDKEYKYYLNILIFYNQFILNQSTAIAKEIKSLIARIDRKIPARE